MAQGDIADKAAYIIAYPQQAESSSSDCSELIEESLPASSSASS